MAEDLAAFLRAQQVLGPNVHAHHHQAIRNARPIPPAGRQIAAKPPIDVTAWLVWERDGLEPLDTTAQAWAGRDVLVAINDVRWPVLGVWLAAQDVRRRQAAVLTRDGVHRWPASTPGQGLARPCVGQTGARGNRVVRPRRDPD